MPRTGRPPTPAPLRFSRMTRVMPNGCVEWTGRIDKDGYGHFLAEGGRKGKRTGAHRWAYEHFVGPIPAGLVIDHLCRNRACVNPDHLEPVTVAENNRRGFGPSRLNAEKTHCLNGHPLSGDNLIVNNGKRACRACRRVRDLARYYENRDAINAKRNARRREARRFAREAKEAS